jgi:hypothetical protein
VELHVAGTGSLALEVVEYSPRPARRGNWLGGERMARAGVRIGIINDVTYEYYASEAWLRPAQQR